MNSSIKMCGLVVCVLLLTSIAMAQQPNLVIQRVTVDDMLGNGPRYRIAHNSCDSMSWCVAGKYLWRSKDSGSTWNKMNLPYGLQYMISPLLYLNKCEVVVQWDSQVFDASYRVAKYANETWIPIVDTSEMWFTHGKGSLITDSVIVVEDKAIDSISISWDGGQTWQKLDIADSLRWFYEDSNQLPGLEKAALILKDTSALEFDPVRKSIGHSNVPVNTMRYKYWDSSHIISSQAYNRDSSSISISRDGGRTWNKITELRFANTSLVLNGSREILHARWMSVNDFGSSTLILSNRMVVSTTDFGETWIYNGKVGNINFGLGMNNVSLTKSGSLFINDRHTIYKLASKLDTIEVLSQQSPELKTLCAITDSAFIGCTYKGVYFTSNGGESWHPSLFDDSVEHNEDEVGSHYASVERIHFSNGKLQAYFPELDAVIEVTKEDKTFLYGTNLFTPTYYHCDDSRFASAGSNFYALHDSTSFGNSGGFLAKAGVAVDTMFFSPAAEESTTLYDQISTGHELVFGDSLYVRSSPQDKWKGVRGGLPLFRNSVAPTACIVQSSTGVIVAGFRGQSFVETDLPVVIPGGIAFSNDTGMTWTMGSVDLSYNPYVWNVVFVNDSLLLASVSQVESNSGRSTLTTSNSHLLRSTDGGKTWKTSYSFADLQRPATHVGHRMTVDNRGIVYALGDRSVVYSLNNGESWNLLSENFDVNICLSDVAVDDTGTVWVASNRGVYRFDPILTDVDVNIDEFRYASVWTYPTPCKDVATIRVNNLDLLNTKRSTLKVYDLYGAQIADLTASLRTSGTTGRLEFQYSTQDLRTGIYLIVLTNQNNKIEKYKMLVVK